jgi:hypothetical protein
MAARHRLAIKSGSSRWVERCRLDAHPCAGQSIALGEGPSCNLTGHFVVFRSGNSPSVDYHGESVRVSGDRPVSRCGSATLALLLGLVLAFASLGLAASVRSLLLRPVMGVRLFVVVTALPAEEKQNFLSVFRHGELRSAIGEFCPTTTKKWFLANVGSKRSIITPLLSTPKPNASRSALPAELSAYATGSSLLQMVKLPPPYLTSDGASLLASGVAPPFNGIDCGSPSTAHPAVRNDPDIWSAKKYASVSSCLYSIRTSPLGLSFNNFTNLSVTVRWLVLSISRSRSARMLSAASSARPP